MPPPRFLPSSFVKTAWQAHSAAVAWPLAEWKASGQFCLFLQHSNTLLLCALVAVCRWLWQHALKERHGHWPSEKHLANSVSSSSITTCCCCAPLFCVQMALAARSTAEAWPLAECKTVGPHALRLRWMRFWMWPQRGRQLDMTCRYEQWLRWMRFWMWPQRDRQWGMTCRYEQWLPALDAFQICVSNLASEGQAMGYDMLVKAMPACVGCISKCGINT